MRKIKKLLFMFVTIVTTFALLVGLNVANAAITVVIEENPGGDTMIGTNSNNSVDSFFIEIVFSKNAVGQVKRMRGGVSEIIGTCTVKIIDAQGGGEQILCSDLGSDTSVGVLTITLTSAQASEGYVSAVTGDLQEIFSIETLMKLHGLFAPVMY